MGRLIPEKFAVIVSVFIFTLVAQITGPYIDIEGGRANLALS
ncbi:MAG: hypothetical protein WAN14_09995 [Candidatus Acidiferrales bacterium]